MTLPDIEHRCGPRVEVDVAIRLIAPRGLSMNCRMRELSVSGALVEAHRSVPELTCVAVRFITPGTPHRISRALRGYVTRCMPGRLALSWMELAPAHVLDLIENGLALRPRARRALPSHNYFQF